MTPIDRYRAATEAWRQATRAREKAAMDRAYAVADLAAGTDVRTAARLLRLSPASVERLIAKARREDR